MGHPNLLSNIIMIIIIIIIISITWGRWWRRSAPATAHWRWSPPWFWGEYFGENEERRLWSENNFSHPSKYPPCLGDGVSQLTVSDHLEVHDEVTIVRLFGKYVRPLLQVVYNSWKDKNILYFTSWNCWFKLCIRLSHPDTNNMSLSLCLTQVTCVWCSDHVSVSNAMWHYVFLEVGSYVRLQKLSKKWYQLQRGLFVLLDKYILAYIQYFSDDFLQ